MQYINEYLMYSLNQIQRMNANATGLAVYAFSGVNGTGTIIASSVITYGNAVMDGVVAKRTNTNIPVLNIPAGNTVYSIGVGTYLSSTNNLQTLGAVLNTIDPTTDYNFVNTGLIRVNLSQFTLANA